MTPRGDPHQLLWREHRILVDPSDLSMTTAPVTARAAIVPGESFRASALGPILVSDRVEIIDVLRGFALSGVLLANMVWLSQEVALTSAQLHGKAQTKQEGGGGSSRRA